MAEMSATLYDVPHKMKTEAVAVSISKGETTLNKCWRRSTSCFGLLCVLQAVTIIVLCIKYTAEKGHLQYASNNLIMETDQLKTSNNNLMTVNGLLQSENERLKKRFTDLGWKYFNFSIYYTSAETLTWTESRKRCRKIGADLVVINSREEQMFISGLSREVWIGLTDAETEGVWKWVDDTLETLGYWMQDQPNNFNGNQNCASVQTEVHPLNSWNDFQCTSEKHWVCEK